MDDFIVDDQLSKACSDVATVWASTVGRVEYGGWGNKIRLIKGRKLIEKSYTKRMSLCGELALKFCARARGWEGRVGESPCMIKQQQQ